MAQNRDLPEQVNPTADEAPSSYLPEGKTWRDIKMSVISDPSSRHDWVRTHTAVPYLLRPSYIRKQLARVYAPEVEIFISWHEPSYHRTRVELHRNETPAKRNVQKFKREKIASGEIPLFDVWIRRVPPATLTREQRKQVDLVNKKWQDAEEMNRQTRERWVNPRTEKQLRMDEMNDLPPAMRKQAEAEERQREREELVRVRQREREELEAHRARAIAIQVERASKGSPIKRTGAGQ